MIRYKNSILCCLLFLLGLAALCYATPLLDRPRPMTLFDGRDMDQWELAQPEGWRIEEGALVPSSAHRKGNYLWTKGDYGDFLLTVQYRLSEGANSGVFYRSDPNDPVQAGFEIQLLDGRGKDEEGRPSQRSNGAIYGAVAPSEYNNAAAGEWNALMLHAKGSNVSVWVNGELMATADFDRWTTPKRNPDGSENKFKTALADLPREGKIGLQYHGQDVAFRHVRITELTDKSPDPAHVTGRLPESDVDLKYWLSNMFAHHGYSVDEASLATGLSTGEVE